MNNETETGYYIPVGQFAEFSFSREDLEQLLDDLPPEAKDIAFRMDHEGKVFAKGVPDA